MSDEANAASNAANESVQPAAAQTVADTAPAQATVTEKPSATTREAIDRAFAKVEAGAQPQQAATTEKAAHAKDDSRNADGTFKAKTPAEAAKPAEAKPQEGEQPKPEAKPVGAAPQRFIKAAQEAWAQTPEPVRAEVERALGELTQGIEKYKGSAEAFEPVRRFDEMARQSGTTLEAALTAYTNIETVINRDPIAGLIEVCRNVGIDPRAAGAAMANMQQLPPRQQPQPQQQQAQQPDPLRKELDEIKATLAKRDAQSAIDKFAADHPYFDELSESISHMLETKFAKDLQDAYDKAIRLSPEVAAKIEAAKAPKPDTAAQTREKAKLQTTGSPASGSTPGTRKPAGSPREAVDNAFASLGL